MFEPIASFGEKAFASVDDLESMQLKEAAKAMRECYSEMLERTRSRQNIGKAAHIGVDSSSSKCSN